MSLLHAVGPRAALRSLLPRRALGRRPGHAIDPGRPAGGPQRGEITLPAFQAHYGYQLDDPAIAFFALHAVADVEHSGRQLELAVKYLEPPEFERALEVCEVGCRLRWDSITEIYRSDVLGEDPIQPPGVG